MSGYATIFADILARYTMYYFIFGMQTTSALEDHEKSDLDPDQNHQPKSDLRSRSDPDLT